MMAAVAAIGTAAVWASPLAAEGPQLGPAIGSQDGEDGAKPGGAAAAPPSPEKADEDSDRSPAAETYRKAVEAFEKGRWTPRSR